MSTKKTLATIGLGGAVVVGAFFAGTKSDQDGIIAKTIGKPSFSAVSVNKYPSSILMASGGVIWDNEFRMFCTNVTMSAEFKEWVISNNVALVVLDVPEPSTGACLFSYDVAKNGLSGAGYLSRKGISPEQRLEYLASNAVWRANWRRTGTGTDPEIIFMTVTNGNYTVIGRVEPYKKNGKYPVAENIALFDKAITIPDTPWIDDRKGIKFLKSYIEIPENRKFVEIPLVSYETNTTSTITVSVESWKPADNERDTFSNALVNTDFKILGTTIPFKDGVTTNSVKLSISRGTVGKRTPNRAFRLKTSNNQMIDVVITDVDG